jgi:hypothetical protein
LILMLVHRLGKFVAFLLMRLLWIWYFS